MMVESLAAGEREDYSKEATSVDGPESLTVSNSYMDWSIS